MPPKVTLIMDLIVITLLVFTFPVRLNRRIFPPTKFRFLCAATAFLLLSLSATCLALVNDTHHVRIDPLTLDWQRVSIAPQH